MMIKKQKGYKLDGAFDITKQRMDFKFMISDTESMLKKIVEELSESIKQIYDWIEQQNQSYSDLFNENIEEFSYSNVVKLVQILQGDAFNDWNVSKNQFMIQLEEFKNLWGQEIQMLSKKMKYQIKEIMSQIQIQSNYEEGEDYQMKEDLFEMLICTQDIDEPIFKVIIEIIKKEKIVDLLQFLQKRDNQKLYEPFINKYETKSDAKKKINKITNILQNIQDHYFNKNDYSTETYQEEREDLIRQQGIIRLRFLVQLTSLDDKFIQCGSNGLNLLIGIKVDLRGQFLENIRIKNTSLIGGNFVRSNLSGSEFDNVDISGINLNGAQLFNCKWKNFKIHEFNKLEVSPSNLMTKLNAQRLK